MTTDLNLKERPETIDPKALPQFARARNGLRASYDWEVIEPILKQALVLHVGFISEGRPMVIPMSLGVIGRTLYIHGAKAGRLIKQNKAHTPVCITVTQVDGIVAARSAFHHSMNYRSAIIHGRARLVSDKQEKHDALQSIVEHLLPGRWSELRDMTEKEVNATGVLAIEIEYAAAKIRSGGPNEEPEDLALNTWGGVVPVTTSLGQPVPDTRLPADVEAPASATAARRKFL